MMYRYDWSELKEKVDRVVEIEQNHQKLLQELKRAVLVLPADDTSKPPCQGENKEAYAEIEKRLECVERQLLVMNYTIGLLSKKPDVVELREANGDRVEKAEQPPVARFTVRQRIATV